MDNFNRMVFAQTPSYNVPVIKEVKDKNGGFLSYGEDNQFPGYLLKLFYGSSLHSAIILRKVDEIVANGLFSLSKNADLTAFIKKCNTKGDSLNDVFRKCALDQELFGGFACQVIYTKKGGEIAELYYVDFSRFRKTITAEKVKYARDWSMMRVKTIEYDLYNDLDKTGSKIFYYNGTTTRDFYPIPSYIGSLAAVETHIEIANFHLNSIKNGLFPSLFIDFKNGEPTEEQKKQIEKDIKAKFGGSSNGGNVMISFSDKDNPSPSIQKIDQNDLDKRFLVLQDSVIMNIFQGHRVTTPSIFGLQQAGKLGNTSEYTQGYNIFTNTYIKPQQKILKDIFNRLLSTNFPDCDLDIVRIEPLNNVFVDEKILCSQMTSGEVRSKLVEWGYIPDAELQPGEKVIGISNLSPSPNKTNDEDEPANNVPNPNDTEND